METAVVEKLKAILFSEEPVYSSENTVVSSSFNEGLSDNELNDIPLAIISKLPQDYLDLMNAFNGFTIFNVQDLCGFRFLGLQHLVSENEFLKQAYEDWDDNILMFCATLGDGNFIGVRVLDDGRYEILDCLHEERPSEWATITNSLSEFLEKVIEFKGAYYWLKL